MTVRFWGGIARRLVLLAFCILVVQFIVQTGENGAHASLVLIAAILIGCFTALQTLAALAWYAGQKKGI